MQNAPKLPSFFSARKPTCRFFAFAGSRITILSTAFRQASRGEKPCRIYSTTRCEPTMRITSSPTPVEVADTDFIVHKKAGTDDGRIAYPAMHFKCHAAGCTGSAEITVAVQRQHANRIVVKRTTGHSGFCTAARIFFILYVDDRFVFGILQPFFPDFFAFRCKQVFFFKSVGQGKLQVHRLRPVRYAVFFPSPAGQPISDEQYIPDTSPIRNYYFHP